MCFFATCWRASASRQGCASADTPRIALDRVCMNTPPRLTHLSPSFSRPAQRPSLSSCCSCCPPPHLPRSPSLCRAGSNGGCSATRHHHSSACKTHGTHSRSCTCTAPTTCLRSPARMYSAYTRIHTYTQTHSRSCLRPTAARMTYTHMVACDSGGCDNHCHIGAARRAKTAPGAGPPRPRRLLAAGQSRGGAGEVKRASAFAAIHTHTRAYTTYNHNLAVMQYSLAYNLHHVYCALAIACKCNVHAASLQV